MIIFIIGAFLLFFTTALDLKSTFIALRNPRIHEGNALIRWAINRGATVSYLFLFGMNAVLAFACYGVRILTHVNLGWCALPLFGGALAHFWAYKHNRKNYL